MCPMHMIDSLQEKLEEIRLNQLRKHGKKAGPEQMDLLEEVTTNLVNRLIELSTQRVTTMHDQPEALRSFQALFVRS